MGANTSFMSSPAVSSSAIPFDGVPPPLASHPVEKPEAPKDQLGSTSTNFRLLNQPSTAVRCSSVTSLKPAATSRPPESVSK